MEEIWSGADALNFCPKYSLTKSLLQSLSLTMITPHSCFFRNYHCATLLRHPMLLPAKDSPEAEVALGNLKAPSRFPALEEICSWISRREGGGQVFCRALLLPFWAAELGRHRAAASSSGNVSLLHHSRSGQSPEDLCCPRRPGRGRTGAEFWVVQ